jgi:hypothetical protein
VRRRGEKKVEDSRYRLRKKKRERLMVPREGVREDEHTFSWGFSLSLFGDEIAIN